MPKDVDPLKWLDAQKKSVEPYLSPDIERTFVKHEKGLADRTGGRQTAGSGNKSDKGDVVTEQFRYEAKCTDGKSLSIKLEWLETIVIQAINTGKKPALSIMFNSAKLPCQKNWIMIEEDTFRDLSGENA